MSNVQSFGREGQPPLQHQPVDWRNPAESAVLLWLAGALICAAAAVGYWRSAHWDGKTAATSSNVKGTATPTLPKVPEAVAGTSSSKRPANLNHEPKRVGITEITQEATQALAWPLWEFMLRDPIPPRDTPLTPLSWRLIGASGAAGNWQLIVLRQGKAEPEFFRVGDKLPGNYRIEAISEEDVTLRHGRREIVLSYIASR